MFPQTNYIGLAPKIPFKVWFTGSTALKEGMGLCYDRNYGTAAEVNERRMTYVELPSATLSNNMASAGVVSRDYAAVSGGQMIVIYLPGSTCKVAASIDTTVGVTRLTCSASAADAGRFGVAGFSGRGSALALQTITDGNIFSSLDGTATAAYAASKTTITKTGIGTACGYLTESVSPVDHKVVILGGATDADSSELAVVGTYAVVTAPTADTITITEDIGDVDVALYVYEGNPTVLAYLEDGKESGLQEFISPQTGVAIPAMVGGITRICGGYTMAADSTDTLADPWFPGLEKQFLGMGTITTKGWKITVTSGLKCAGGGALATILFDAADEQAYLVGGNNIWRSLATEGATEA